MKKAWNIVGMIMAGLIAVILLVDKIYQWVAASKLLRLFNRYEPIYDKAAKYLEDELD